MDKDGYVQVRVYKGRLQTVRGRSTEYDKVHDPNSVLVDYVCYRDKNV